MSALKDFTAQWVKNMATIVPLLILMGSFAAVAVGFVGFPMFVGSYLEFGSFAQVGMATTFTEVPFWILAVQVIWLVMVFAGILALAQLDYRKYAESNGGACE